MSKRRMRKKEMIFLHLAPLADCVPRMLRSAPHWRRGALLIRGPRMFGFRLCGAS